MYDTCPGCKYDLSGLNREEVAVCPECGGDTSHLGIVLTLERRRRRALWFYFLAPLLALPGCGAYLIGQPVLCLAISTLCAFRAIALEDQAKARDPMPVASFVQALLLGAAWTVAGTGLLSLTVAMVATLIGHYR